MKKKKEEKKKYEQPARENTEFVKVRVDSLHIHKLNDFEPVMHGPEFEALFESIKKRGVKDEPLVDKHGGIISGQRRWLITKKLKHEFVRVERYKNELSSKEARDIIIEMNIGTRRITNQQFSKLFDERFGQEVDEQLESGEDVTDIADRINKRAKLGMGVARRQVMRRRRDLIAKKFSGNKLKKALIMSMPPQKLALVGRLIETCEKEEKIIDEHVSKHREAYANLSKEVKASSFGIKYFNITKDKTDLTAKTGVKSVSSSKQALR